MEPIAEVTLNMFSGLYNFLQPLYKRIEGDYGL